MTKFNYRHSLATINKVLSARNEKINFSIVSGRSIYTVKELDVDSGNYVVCGYFYSASDVAEYANKVANAN